MESKNERIELMIRSAMAAFDASLDHFYPAFEDNGFNERNLSFQVAQAFCRAHRNAHAFFEVPIESAGSSKDRTDNHFDTFLFDEDLAIVVEAKRLYSSEKNVSLMKDIQRMHSHAETLLGMFEKTSVRKRKLYGLVIAEHWEVDRGRERQDVLEWWTRGTGDVAWDDKLYPTRWRYNSITVRAYEKTKGEPSSKLHWLYGYGTLPVT